MLVVFDEDGSLIVVMVDFFNIFVIEDLEIYFGKRIKFRIVKVLDIKRVIEKFFGK